MIKILPTILAFLATTYSASVFAAQFESIVQAFATPIKSDHNVMMWKDVEKIKNIKWKWPYYESGAYEHTMVGLTKVGKDKNPNIGATEVTIQGSRMNLYSIYIDINMEGEDPSEKQINHFFGAGKVKKIRTSCDEDGHSYSVATYKFQKPGYNPVFIRSTSSWGASGAGSTGHEIYYDLPTSCDL